MKTLINGCPNYLSKRTLFLIFVPTSVVAGWIAGIVLVFAVPFLMLAWSVAVIVSGGWWMFAWCVSQAAKFRTPELADIDLTPNRKAA